MASKPFYMELLTQDLNSYELKMFRVQHDETQLSSYLRKLAKKHEESSMNKIYLIRYSVTKQLVGWFGLKAATLPLVNDVAQKVACKALFVFAINHPKLVDYYKTKLGFKEIRVVDDKQFFEYAAPDYDFGCKFLYFPLGK